MSVNCVAAVISHALPLGGLKWKRQRCTFSVQSSGTGLWREAEHRLSSVTAHGVPAGHGGRLELHWKGIIALFVSMIIQKPL